MKMSKLAMAAYQSPLTFYLKVNEWEVFRESPQGPLTDLWLLGVCEVHGLHLEESGGMVQKLMAASP